MKAFPPEHLRTASQDGSWVALSTGRPGWPRFAEAESADITTGSLPKDRFTSAEAT